MIYIASPFFNEKQLNLVKEIEERLTEGRFDFYSPRLGGILGEMTPKEREVEKSNVYKDNLIHLVNCKMVVAVIDGRDVGTIWEMGFATAINRPVVSFSDEGFGLNVMLAESVKAHVNSMDDLMRAILDPEYRKIAPTEVY